ncbi:MAG: putative ABC exporter domain-containing protein [Fimbriimonas sp.]
MRAIALLSLWKIKNSLRTALSDPRKLFPILIIGFFVGFSLLMSGIASGTATPPKTGATLSPQYLEVGIRIALLFVIYGVLEYSLGDGLLALGRSDVDYLFPSPVSRRAVLVLRLPGLLLGTLFQAVFLLFALRSITQSVVMASASHLGTTVSPSWVPPAAVLLCVVTYLNLGLFAAIQFPRRRSFRWWVIGGFVALGLFLAYVGWRQGLSGLSGVLNSPALRIVFWPAAFAADILFAASYRQPLGPGLGWLALTCLASFVPMFLTNANWYEQSVVSTERIATLRQAAKGGFASIMAAKAATHRHRGDRTYTVRPFGQGAVALFWAHLCSAAKRPGPNFLLPVFGGIVVGAAGAVIGILEPRASAGIVAGALLYATFGFMAAARTACEASVRRRELVSPLPIDGWQNVAADLAVPVTSLFLYSLGVALVYAIAGAPQWPFVAFGALILYPLRTASRMTLQYILVLGYPDFSDKVQQFVAQFAYWLLAVPFILAEVVVLLPAFFLKSVWLGLVSMSILEVGLLALFLALAGRASERAVATGEPVSIWSLRKA